MRRAGGACRAVPFRFAGLLVHDELTLDHGTVVGFEETVQRRVIYLYWEGRGGLISIYVQFIVDRLVDRTDRVPSS